jgi:hypothetical protein
MPDNQTNHRFQQYGLIQKIYMWCFLSLNGDCWSLYKLTYASTAKSFWFDLAMKYLRLYNSEYARNEYGFISVHVIYVFQLLGCILIPNLTWAAVFHMTGHCSQHTSSLHIVRVGIRYLPRGSHLSMARGHLNSGCEARNATNASCCACKSWYLTSHTIDREGVQITRAALHTPFLHTLFSPTN